MRETEAEAQDGPLEAEHRVEGGCPLSYPTPSAFLSNSLGVNSGSIS